MIAISISSAASTPGNTIPLFLWEVDHARLENMPIAVASHCFGCTAGSGSSCGGALT
jgi:hypothetical protein